MIFSWIFSTKKLIKTVCLVLRCPFYYIDTEARIEHQKTPNLAFFKNLSFLLDLFSERCIENELFTENGDLGAFFKPYPLSKIFKVKRCGFSHSLLHLYL